MYIHSLHIGGGAENVFFQIAKSLNLAGFEVVVCGLLDEDPSFEADFKTAGIKVIRFSFQKYNFWQKLGFISQLTEIIKSENPDVVFNWLFPCVISGGISARRAGVKHIIANLRGPDLKKKKYKVLLERLFSRNHTGFIAVSKGVKTIFTSRERYPEQQVTIIENGIDLFIENEMLMANNYNFLRKYNLRNSFVVGTIGRMYIEKNQQLLIKAIPELKKLIFNLKVVLVGDGPYRKEIEKLVVDLGVEDVVVFAGWQKDAYKLLKVFDVFVLPSNYEGHPNVVLQSWLARVPVVATKVIGIKDLIVDGKNGLLFDKSKPESLTNILYNLRQAPQLVRKLTGNGYQTVQECYSNVLMEKAYQEYFANLGK